MMKLAACLLALVGAKELTSANWDAETSDGKDLCETHGVQGFPTIKWGDAGDLKDYSGGRDFDSLKKFAEENLGPQCGPTNLDLCNAKTREKLEKFMAMSQDRVEAKITNAVRIFEEEVPLMKKVVAYMKTKDGGKTDL